MLCNQSRASYLFMAIAMVAIIFFCEPAGAAILLDKSPATTGATVITNALGNASTSQNFAEDFSFSSAASLTAMDIYMSPLLPVVGDSVTIRLYEDTSGIPGTLLTELIEEIAIIDSEGAVTGNVRVHADFTTPISLDAAKTYWIGMSGTSKDLDLTGLSGVDPTGTMAQFTGTTFGFFTGEVGADDMAFRLEGTLIPEPTTGLLLLVGIGFGFLRIFD